MLVFAAEQTDDKYVGSAEEEWGKFQCSHMPTETLCTQQKTYSDLTLVQRLSCWCLVPDFVARMFSSS